MAFAFALCECVDSASCVSNHLEKEKKEKKNHFFLDCSLFFRFLFDSVFFARRNVDFGIDSLLGLLTDCDFECRFCFILVTNVKISDTTTLQYTTLIRSASLTLFSFFLVTPVVLSLSLSFSATN